MKNPIKGRKLSSTSPKVRARVITASGLFVDLNYTHPSPFQSTPRIIPKLQKGHTIGAFYRLCSFRSNYGTLVGEEVAESMSHTLRPLAFSLYNSVTCRWSGGPRHVKTSVQTRRYRSLR